MGVAVSQLQNDKSPGCDGLSTEFFKLFWGYLKAILHETCLYAFQHHKLGISTRRGIITLIPKKNRDIYLVRNWRPLTLFNIDYKILSKALANRIKPILQYLIHEDQTGFMEGRNISTNIRKTFEIIQYAIDNRIPALIMTIDFAKCFDRIEHCAMESVLNYFGFGPNYIQWIM